MNGSSVNNNTVSPRQVKRIADEVDSVVSQLKNELESCTIEFNNKISKYWADEVAVDFAKNVSNSMNGVITNLATGSNNLKEGIVNVANEYAKQAHKPLMNASRTTFHSAINPSVVKSTFEDGDTYGLRDINDVAKMLVDLNSLSSKIYQMGDQFSARLNSINAFGNSEISNKISVVSRNMVDSLHRTSMKIRDRSFEVVEDAYKRYQIPLDQFETILNNAVNTVNDNKGIYGFQSYIDDLANINK